MFCPHDQRRLVISRKEGHPALACPACHGAWLTFKLLADVGHRKHFTGGVFIKQLRAATRDDTALGCPAGCGKLHCAVVHGIELDWCPGCSGVWCDHGELRKLLAAIPQRPVIPLQHMQVGKRESGSSWDAIDAGADLIEAIIEALSSS